MTFEWPPTMTLALLALLSLVVVYLAYSLRHLKKDMLTGQEENTQKLKVIRRDMDIINKASVGVGQRLMAIERKLNLSIEKQQQIEATNVEYLHYARAAEMAEGGATAEQLASNCGIPEAEAKLMAMVQEKH